MQQKRPQPVLKRPHKVRPKFLCQSMLPADTLQVLLYNLLLEFVTVFCHKKLTPKS